MRGNLNRIDIDLMAGLVRSIRPERLGGKGLTAANNLTANVEFESLGRISGDRQLASFAGIAAAYSLHWFEYFDPDGTFNQKLIALNAGSLYEVDRTGVSAATLIGGGGTIQSEAMMDVQALNRMHFCSVNNDPQKYDGSSITKWGINAPGGTPNTPKDALNATAGWTVTAGDSVALSTARVQGTGSLKLTKAATGTTLSSITKTGLALNFGGAGVAAYFSAYIPYAMATKVNYIELMMGDAGMANASEYRFPMSELVPGWNLCAFDITAPDAVIGGGAPLGAVADIRFMLVTRANADVGYVQFDALYNTDNGVPAAGAPFGVGVINGTVSYRCTYVSIYGVESNAGPASNSVAPVNQQVTVTLPSGATIVDPQTRSVRIYRDLAADGVYRLVAEVNAGTATYTDNTANSSRSTTTPPYAGDSNLDSTPPERFLTARYFEKRVFAIHATRRNELWVSDIAEPELFPLVNIITLNDDLTALELHSNGLLLFSSDRTYAITGDGVTTPISITLVNPSVGCNGWRAVARVKSICVSAHENNLYLFENPADPWSLNQNIANVTGGNQRNNQLVIHDPTGHRVYWFRAAYTAPNDTPPYDRCNVWEYASRAVSQVSPDGPGIDPLDLRIGFWTSMAWPTTALDGVTQKFLAAVVFSDGSDLSYLAVADDGGLVNRWFDSASLVWHTTAGTKPVRATIQFLIPLGNSPEDRGSLRSMAFNARIDGSAGADWNYQVDYKADANGTTLATVTGTVPLAGSSTRKAVIHFPPWGSHGSWALVTLAQASTTASPTFFRRISAYTIPRFGAIRAQSV